MGKALTEKQKAYNDKRAADAAKRKLAKAETDAVFADEDTVVAHVRTADGGKNPITKGDVKSMASAAITAEKKEAARLQKQAESDMRRKDEKDRKDRVAVAKAKAAEERAAKKIAREADLAAKRAEREANKVPRRATEATMTAKWPNEYVPGSLRYETEGKYAGKQTAEKYTLDVNDRPDGLTIRIATSDFFQVKYQPSTLQAVRRARAKVRRDAAKTKSA